jgi:septal ring factor EnvC (AmiA/AmiB activator)
MPVSAYPTTGYPMAPMPPMPARTSAWTWVLLASTIVLFLAAGGLGFGYYSARSAVLDRNSQIEGLQADVAAKDDTIAEQDDQIEQAEQTLADVETELTDAQTCVDAMEAALSAPTEEEFNVLFDEMLSICDF